MTSKNILITGGNGLIGRELSRELFKRGHTISLLSRTPNPDLPLKTWLWDVENDEIDPESIDAIDVIIHLAGAGVAEKRWTDSRKQEIIDSRVKSIQLIYKLLADRPNKVSTIISASATGFYADRGDELLTENSLPGNDFLANCCVEWEAAVDDAAMMGLRVVKFRTGVVLTKYGGALPQLVHPIELYVGSALGSGKQWVPWIHWRDVVDMYVFAVENDTLAGVYNMVSPAPVTNQQLIKAIAHRLHKPLWAPRVPAFVLKAIMGEMSTVVLASTRVAAEKIESEGFVFKYPGINDALAEIYH